MKTLLVAVNAKYIHSNPAVYLLKKSAEAYRDRLHLDTGEIALREFTINQSPETIYYTILAEKADVVAFSVYIWNIEIISRLCQDLKAARPKCEIWLGGPEVSYGVQGKLLAASSFDRILEGEGERIFFSLLAEKNGGSVPADWKVQKEGKRAWAKPIENLDELPFIYEDLTPFRNRILYYEASRGCPFHCAYCLSAAKQGVRELPLPRVLSELSYLAEQGVPQVKLVDRTFNCREARAKPILQWILDLPEDCPTNFHFEVEADLLSDSLIDLMVQMPKGRIQLEIGIQSTYPEALRACGRTDRLSRVFHNVQRLRQSGNINVHVDLIAGLPLETYARFQQSFDEVYHLKAHQFQLGFLKLLTGAPMNDLIEPYGYVFSKHPPYEILRNDFLSEEELYELKCVEDVLERLYNSGRFSRFLDRLETQYAGPFTMMQAIAEVFRQKELCFTAMGMNQLYEEMAQLAEAVPIAQACREALLLDYYAATSADQLPPSLRPLAEADEQKFPPQEKKLQAAALLKRIGRRRRKMVVRLCAGALVAMDYTERDSVTGQYEVVEIVSVKNQLE